MRAWAKLRTPRSFEACFGASVLDKLVSIFLLLAAANLLVVLITGYKLTLGPFSVSTHHHRTPLLLFLALAMISTWLHGKRNRIPTRARLRSPLMLFLMTVFIYNLHGTTLVSHDNIPARYLPLSILREFDFDLDEFPFLYEANLPHFLQESQGRIVSSYPPWAAVLALPIYFLPVLGGISPLSPFLPDLENFSAALIMALSVVLFYLAVRRLTHEKIAWLVALIYAFGTSSFSTSSQSLWQHGPSQLFLALTIYWLIKGTTEHRFSAFAGLPLVAAVMCRPTNIVMALPIGAYILHKHRDQFIGFCCAAVPPLLLFMTYNYVYFGSPFTTGFGATSLDASAFWQYLLHLSSTSLQDGLLGVLVSPSRGLLIYSPILLFSGLGIILIWGKPGHILLKYLSLAPLLLTLLMSKWSDWWGGYSYGPRLLADATPFLCLYLYRPLEQFEARPLLKHTFASLAVLSIGLHTVGVFSDGTWNAYLPPGDVHREYLWSWVESPPVYYVRHAFLARNRAYLALPTSRNAPHKLAASYELISLPHGSMVHANAFVDVQVNVLNTGEAVWLARARGNKGAVRLGWRWYKGDQEIPSASGRQLLRDDLFPGQSYEFRARIATPKEPGDYVLELDMVSEHLIWFAQQGHEPLNLAIRLVNPRGMMRME